MPSLHKASTDALIVESTNYRVAETTVVASYYGLYEEGGIEYINMFGLVF